VKREKIEQWHGMLRDASSCATIRPATAAELRASTAAAKKQNSNVGIIVVDGRACFVGEASGETVRARFGVTTKARLKK